MDDFKKARDEAEHKNTQIGSDFTSNREDRVKQKAFITGADWAYKWCKDNKLHKDFNKLYGVVADKNKKIAELEEQLKMEMDK